LGSCGSGDCGACFVTVWIGDGVVLFGRWRRRRRRRKGARSGGTEWKRKRRRRRRRRRRKAVGGEDGGCKQGDGSILL